MSIQDFLYNTKTGRILLRPLISRPVSVLLGAFLDSRLSAVLIPFFVKKQGIRLSDYRLKGIKSFNDFFCRRLKKGLRTVSRDINELIAPCDGLLSVYSINALTVLSVKQSSFSIDRLLKDPSLSAGFEGGYALVFRLCVDNYHRYIYFDSGKQHKTRRIKGVYHTVRPVALEKYPVFIENSREYTVIDTEAFGRAVQMEVGALLVGRIVNLKRAPAYVKRGEEKGYFEFGGSTVMILLPEGAAELRPDILKTLNTNTELPVLMGETVGRACRHD